VLVTAAAPRLDPRLVQFLAGARLGTPAAEVTRAAGELAWALGLPRPSYEQVRFLLRRLRPLTSIRRLRGPAPPTRWWRGFRTAVGQVGSARRKVATTCTRSARRLVRWCSAIAEPS
jgi:hypothetical protein